MEMTVIEASDTLSHLALNGRLDLEGVQAVELKFNGHTAARRQDAIVDVSQLSFVASLGMGMLLNVAKSLARYRKRLILVNPQDMVQVALKAARLTDILEIAPTVERAKAMLNGEKEPA